MKHVIVGITAMLVVSGPSNIHKISVGVVVIAFVGVFIAVIIVVVADFYVSNFVVIVVVITIVIVVSWTIYRVRCCAVWIIPSTIT